MGRAIKRKGENGPVHRYSKVRKVVSKQQDSASDASEFFGFEENGVFSQEEDSAGAEDARDDSLALDESAKKVKSAPQAAQKTNELDGWAKSDLVKLQVDALLANVQPDEAAEQPLDDFIRAVESLLKSASSRAPSSVSSATKELRREGVAVPFCEPRPAQDVQWKLAFEPPRRIEQVGSRVLDSACAWKGQDGWSVDLAVFMPDALHQANDYKEFRYLHKRAYFLACLAAALKASSLGKSVQLSFAYLHGDSRKPVLELRPIGGSKHDLRALRCFVRLLPVYDISSHPLKIARLHPRKDNLRNDDEDASESSSSSYNAAILSDGYTSIRQRFLADTSERVPHFAEACQLLKIWAHQRGLGENSEHASEVGLEGVRYLLTMFLAHLVAKGEKGGSRLPPRADAWQLFRGTLEWLGQADFLKRPIAMRQFANQQGAREAKEFAIAGQAVMVDPCGCINLLQDVPRTSLEYLCHLARTTTRSLAGNSLDGFEDALARSHDEPHLTFDICARLTLTQDWLLERFEDIDAPSRVSAAVASLSRVLKRALGDRATCISFSRNVASSHSLDKVSPASEHLIVLGVLVNSLQAGRLVDYGPPAEDVEAAEDFKRFWGHKSELRRFKDGSILESVVWTADTPLARGAIVGQVLQYMLCESPHFGLEAKNVDIFCGAFDDLLSDAMLPADKGFTTIQSAFDALSKTLRGLDGLPLSISSIAASSEALRYSSVFVPQPSTARVAQVCSYVPVMDVHLSFESSSRWPNDLEAIQKIKAAILVSIAQKLKNFKLEEQRCSRTEIAFDANAAAQGDNVSLEVLTSQGFAFRLRVHYEGETERLQSSIMEHRGTAKADVLNHLLALCNKRFIARPRHHAAIAALQHRHASFSGAVRIFKRWLAAHLFSPHISAEAAELLVAHVYLCPGAQGSPASAATAFARTLNLLSRWKWRTTPLITPIYSALEQQAGRIDFAADKAAEAQKLCDQLRKSDPQLRRGALLLATERDLSGREWTWQAPNRVVTLRLVEVAKATLSALATGLDGKSLDMLFTPPLTAFDFIVHLDSAQLPRYSQSLNADVQTLRASKAEKTSALLGFDPAVLLLDRLQSFFGDTALLFHDMNGGSVVAGVFDPSLAKARDWRVHLDFACKPEEDGRVTLDREALMAGVRRIGGSLVQRIELKD